MLAIGIMTGTSLDGVDVGVIETDGYFDIQYLDNRYLKFPPELVSKIKRLMHEKFGIAEYRLTEKEYTEFCYLAIKPFLAKYKVDVIGFHGQTLYHSPANAITHQMGYAKYLQKLCGTKVVFDIRTDDILQGREGAPLVPLFHKAAIVDEPPFAVINIGGVSNITYIGALIEGQEDIINWPAERSLQSIEFGKRQNIMAFDMGPGCAPSDDIMNKHYGFKCDKDGEKASFGTPNMGIIEQLLSNEYFSKSPPKSLDRDHFNYQILDRLEPQDQLATVIHFAAQSIEKAYKMLPAQPKVTYLCGGGRRNKLLCKLLQNMFHVQPVDVLGLDGDMLEAYAFAYLAARKQKGLYYGSV